MSLASDGLPIYGWEITYLRHDGVTRKCHYVGSLRTAERRAMLKPLAKEIESRSGFSQQQWVRSFGRGRM
jgi:hypothetical protein